MLRSSWWRCSEVTSKLVCSLSYSRSCISLDSQPWLVFSTRSELVSHCLLACEAHHAGRPPALLSFLLLNCFGPFVFFFVFFEPLSRLRKVRVNFGADGTLLAARGTTWIGRTTPLASARFPADRNGRQVYAVFSIGRRLSATRPTPLQCRGRARQVCSPPFFRSVARYVIFHEHSVSLWFRHSEHDDC